MMSKCFIIASLCILICFIRHTYSLCDMIPSSVVTRKSRNDIKYVIEISGRPKNYTANQKYNVSLKCNEMQWPQVPFVNFILTVQSLEEGNENNEVGNFELIDESLTSFSTECTDTVVETSMIPKTEIQVFWTAPPKGSGCVAIKASVVEAVDNWFSEDGDLTRILCEDTSVDENLTPRVLTYCCACPEAKYEVALEGKWTRITHPRFFPAYQQNTRFSDVIGASHRLYHAFWEYEQFASKGMKQLADTGSTKELESELKNNREHIRTIIKARGLQYPNITRSTYAVFRVDNKNHLVSLVSKIIPSPDWVVGVSNLELCREDCTWLESITLNLYPWDVGVNDGLKYTSWEPADYQSPIRRITANNPNNPESPFYDKDGKEMSPIAKLHLTRQRIYEKTCDGTGASEHGDCVTTEWTDWSPCSVKCGEGLRYRHRRLRDPNEENICDIPLFEHEVCFGVSDSCHTKTGEEEAASPETDGEDAVKTEMKKIEEIEEDSNCPDTEWGDWTDCSVTCGRGYRSRVRKRKDDADTVTDEDAEDCFKPETEECNISCETEEENRGSAFTTLDTDSIVVSQGPDGEVIDCEVGQWSRWSSCQLSDEEESCGEGYKTKSREILKHPENGGRSCPKHLLKTKSCRISCLSKGHPEKCVMGPWSNWTPCSSNCGSSAVQIKTRNIEYQPPGVVCNEKREEIRPCRIPLACTEDGKPIF